MELKRFWTIFKRRWLLVLIPVVIVLGVGLATYQSPPDVYNAGMRFLVAQEPGATAVTDDEQRYYNWLTSEYVVNGLTDWARSGAFAELVSQELAGQGYDVPPWAVQGSLAADNARSMLTISVTYGDTPTTGAIIDAVATVLIEQNGAALPQLGGATAVVTPLDQVHVNQVSAGIRSQLDLPLRVGLALVAGLGLALVVEYLDPALRERREVEMIGLPVLGEIPRK